jgi:hypothetical protein
VSESRRRSIAPTYDSGGEPGACAVETRVAGRLVSVVPMSDPFVSQRVTVGWRDLLRGLLRRRLEVEVIVGGDRDRIEDVTELDAGYLGAQHSSRRAEWNARVNGALRDA